MRAYKAALDYYQHGYNSLIGDTGFLSLQDLATSPGRKNVTTQFKYFSSYYGSDDYGNAMILDMINGVDEFSGASTSQRTEAIAGTITGVITYMAVLEKAFGAIARCREGVDTNTTEAALSLLDQAVAFYVGSIEGEQAGGRSGGQMLYGVAKNLCEAFGVCENGDAKSNLAIIQAFKTASILLTNNTCDEAEQIVFNEINQALLVPLIQGILNYAVINDGLLLGTQEGSLGAGDAYAHSILPLVAVADSASAVVIRENMKFSVIDAPVSDGAQAVFWAVQDAVFLMTTPDVSSQCSSLIGRFGNGTSYVDVCKIDAPPMAPVETPVSPGGNPAPIASPLPSVGQAAPSALALGRYNFENDVSGVAKLALDVRDMQKGTLEAANQTYIEGGNAQTKDGDRTVSLAALSRTAASDMDQDPVFNLIRWALLNESVFERVPGDDNFDQLDSAYPDIIVVEALEVAQDK